AGRQQRCHHAQRGGLAGAVGPEQRGDAAIGGVQSDALHSRDGAGLAPAPQHEALVQLLDANHGPLACNGANTRGWGSDAAQLASTCSAAVSSAASMKRTTASRTQGRAITPCPALGTTVWRALAPSARAMRSPWRGGVAGSAAPDSSQVADGADGVA